jgi:release factor glutamine methyltransferase
MPRLYVKIMDLKTALEHAVGVLTSRDVGSPRLAAEVLLMHALDCDRAHLLAHPERVLTPDEMNEYHSFVHERANGKPTQYITGHQEFWGMDLLVSEAVLIPRPETEHSVEAVLELARADSSIKKIVDVGTGSGCIALAVAKELPDREIHATDISAVALVIAQENAERLGLAGVQFRCADLLADAKADAYDLVVSNPPYVGKDEPEKVQKMVRDWEPHVAVFGGATGLEMYERLIPQAMQALRPGGWLVMEIGYSIEQPIRKFLKEWLSVEIKPDLQGIPRVAVAKRP